MADDRCDLLCLDARSAERIRHALPSPHAIGGMAAAARAFSDPTRAAIALALAESEELCVCDLTWIMGRPQNLVSHHLRRLRIDGMASSERRGKVVFYRLTGRGRAALDALASLHGKVQP